MQQQEKNNDTSVEYGVKYNCCCCSCLLLLFLSYCYCRAILEEQRAQKREVNVFRCLLKRLRSKLKGGKVGGVVRNSEANSKINLLK